MAKGVAALGTSYVVVGLHTGEIVMFRVCYDEAGYQCEYLARYRNHLRNITDLASTTTTLGSVLASGDMTGDINIWSLEVEEEERLVHRSKIGDWSGHSVTTLAVWNKYKEVSLGLDTQSSVADSFRVFSSPDTGAVTSDCSAWPGATSSARSPPTTAGSPGWTSPVRAASS